MSIDGDNEEQPDSIESDSVDETEPMDAADDDAPTHELPALHAAPEEQVPAPVEVPPQAAVSATPSPEEQAAADELDAVRAAYPWFVVQTYSGYEMRAKLSLEERVRSHGLTHKFGRILVPQETVEEMVRGAKRTSKKKFFPGYILVQVALDDDTWHLVKETPKVSGFIGDSRNPSPLSESEVNALIQQMEGGAKRPRPRKQFEEGDAVKVTDGPFADFNGTVDEVKPDKGKLRVLISIFGRNTPVELDFGQVEKV